MILIAHEKERWEVPGDIREERWWSHDGVSHHQRSKSPLGKETSREEWRGEDATPSLWSWRDLQSWSNDCEAEQPTIRHDETESVSAKKVREREMRERESHWFFFTFSKRTKRQGDGVSGYQWARFGLKSKPVEICEGLDFPTYWWASSSTHHGPRQVACPLQQQHLITYTTYIWDVSMLIRLTLKEIKQRQQQVIILKCKSRRQQYKINKLRPKSNWSKGLCCILLWGLIVTCVNYLVHWFGVARDSLI